MYPEPHFFIGSRGVTTVAHTQAYYDFNSGIEIGSLPYDRIGNIISLDSLDVYFNLADCSGQNNTTAEIDILYDKNCNGAYPNEAYEHDNVSSIIDVFLKEEYIKRFVLLSQITLFINRVSSDNVPSNTGVNVSATINGIQHDTFSGTRINLDLSGLTTEFSADINRDITEISSGSLLLYAWSSEIINFSVASKLKFYC